MRGKIDVWGWALFLLVAVLFAIVGAMIEQARADMLPKPVIKVFEGCPNVPSHGAQKEYRV